MTDLSVLNLSISGPFDMKINKNKNNCENYKISDNQNILIKFKDEQTLKLLFLSNNINMYNIKLINTNNEYVHIDFSNINSRTVVENLTNQNELFNSNNIVLKNWFGIEITPFNNIFVENKQKSHIFQLVITKKN